MNRTHDGSKATPREVYSAACKKIAAAIVADGYLYVQSGPKLYRKSHDFVFQIIFQSSHRNIQGKLVALWIHGNVISPTLKQWRSANPCLVKGSDGVAGGQIGNLIHPPSWMEWNLAIASKRNKQIADAIATLRRITYPYFAMFDDTPSLITRLVKEDLPSFPPASALDFIMCFGSTTDALRAAQNMLQRLPGANERYPVALARFRREGLPTHTLTNHGEVLAAATLLYGFPDLRAG